MKKVSKRVRSTKVNDDKFFSLNGDMLKKIKGGSSLISGPSNTDRVCGGGCGYMAMWADGDGDDS